MIIVIETKIDNALEDLRVSNPFPPLLAAATAQPFEAMDNATHSHFPWVLVLIAFSQKWRQQVSIFFFFFCIFLKLLFYLAWR